MDSCMSKGRKGRFILADGGDDKFGIIWSAFRIAFSRHSRGFEQLQMCNAIGAHLMAISDLRPEGGDNSMRALTCDSEIVLTAAEYIKLQQLLEDPEVPWTFAAGQRAEETILWLRNWPEVEIEVTEKADA